MNSRYNVLSILVALIICTVMCFGSIGSVPVFAADEEDGIEDGSVVQAAVAVYWDDQLVNTYTMDELWSEADDTAYTYSAFNSYPTEKELIEVKGVHVETLLNQSIDGSIDDDQIIEIVGNDGASMKFMKKQLLAERYYYPNFKNEVGRKGQKALPTSGEDGQLVPAIISLDEPYCESEDEIGRLIIGQTSPTEQNYSAFVKYIARGDREFNVDTGLEEGTSRSIGKIIVHSETAPKLNPIRTTNAGAGGALKYGTVLMFNRNANTNPTKVSERYCIYYTTDGSEPDMTSNLYNYNNYNFGKDNEAFNKAAITKEGMVTIKTKVVGYGRQDSEVSTFRFIGVKNPATPKITAITTKKKAITLKWSIINGATGYKIYRSMKKNGKYSLVKTITSGKTITWKNKKLKKKKKYYYKIMAYKTVSGKTFNSGYSAVKYKKVK
ncbi:MAG: hypothetical protein E7221_03255 [Clostridiales bacterium]|nr:hypothetical protein [Clostridiales bacterium]